MKIKYDRLWKKLKIENIYQKDFKKNLPIGGSTFDKLKANENINTSTICKICDYLHCMPDEIMEFIPEPDIQINPEIAETEKQIAELQEKLQRLKSEEEE